MENTVESDEVSKGWTTLLLTGRASDRTEEPLPDSIYCDLVNTLNSKCVQSSLLEIWRYRPELVNTASQEEILRAVNQLE